VRTWAVAGTIVAAMADLAACANQKTQGGPVPVADHASPTSTSSTTTKTVPPPVTTTTPPAPPPDILGPQGFGQIKLGMTKSQALATGELVVNDPSSDEHCTGYDLKAFPTPPEEVSVYISPNNGVVAIFATKAMHTPEGIALGSTLAKVKAAYPEVAQEDPNPEDPEYLPTVPGNPKAQYRISFENNKVAGLGIEQNQDCFD
jgi:hypothetical protein